MEDTSGGRDLGSGIGSLKETGIEIETVVLEEDVLLEMEVEEGTGWTGETDSQDGRRTVITVEEHGRGTEDEIVTGTEIETVIETGGTGESDGAALIVTETAGGTVGIGETVGIDETEGRVRDGAETEREGDQARARRATGRSDLNAGRGLHDGTMTIV